jgi:ribonuclease D
MTIYCHKGDLPDNFTCGDLVAVDTETLGLKHNRDRLCVVQVSNGNGDAHIVQMTPDDYDKAPRLKAILNDSNITKIYHYARFDVAVLRKYLGIGDQPLYCTKIASRFARTYTDRHSLKAVCDELLDVQLDKQQQSSNWAADELSEAQQRYAASDVLYLHALKEKLDEMLIRENRKDLAYGCFDFVNHRAVLDLAGWEDQDIFNHM